MKKNSLLTDLEKQNNIIRDSFDELIYQDIIKNGKEIKNSIKDGKEFLNTFPALSEDVFNSLYKLDPKLTKFTPFGTEMNRKQIQSFMETSQFETLRDYTRLDDFYAASACSTVLNEIVGKLREDKELQDMCKKQNEMNKDKNEDGSKKSEEQKQNEQKQMQNEMNKASSKIRQALRAGIKKATEDAEQNDQMIEGLGWGDETSEFKRLPFSDKQSLLMQLQKVKEMAKVIGRMKELALSSRASKIKSNQVELCGITMGNDITKALPQELTELNHPVLKYNFYRKFAERQLLQYELKKNEDKGKGHIICLVDDSGSMYGGNNIIARGAMFGLMECAKRDKRNFACDIFSSYREEYKREILNGSATIQDTMDLLTASFGGGTDYEAPIKYAMEIAKKNEFQNADIVIITDGECELRESTKKELIKFKEETGTKVVAICLGYYGNGLDLEKWCDSIYKDLGNETLSEIYKNL